MMLILVCGMWMHDHPELYLHKEIDFKGQIFRPKGNAGQYVRSGQRDHDMLRGRCTLLRISMQSRKEDRCKSKILDADPCKVRVRGSKFLWKQVKIMLKTGFRNLQLAIRLKQANFENPTHNFDA